MIMEQFYTSGEYLERNPAWHVDESPWKANAIMQMMKRNNIAPKTICEIGCGAGEILKILQGYMDADCELRGYEISPQAIELCQPRANERLHFKLGDVRDEKDAHFDLILIIDVLEHFENCFSFLRDVKTTSDYKILQLPLDIFVTSVLFGNLIRYRHATGHLHFFTKEIALQVLKDNGYEILDYFYTIEPSAGFPWDEMKKRPAVFPKKLLGFLKRKLLRLPRMLFYAINKDLAVRVLGEWRLVVLIK